MLWPSLCRSQRQETSATPASLPRRLQGRQSGGEGAKSVQNRYENRTGIGRKSGKPHAEPEDCQRRETSGLTVFYRILPLPGILVRAARHQIARRDEHSRRSSSMAPRSAIGRTAGEPVPETLESCKSCSSCPTVPVSASAFIGVHRRSNALAQPL